MVRGPWVASVLCGALCASAVAQTPSPPAPAPAPAPAPPPAPAPSGSPEPTPAIGDGSAAPAPIGETIPQPTALPPPAPTAPPETVVVSSVGRTDLLVIGGAGAALGASVVLFMSAQSASDDANKAALFQDHSDIEARSTRLYIASGVFAAAAIGLGYFEYTRLHKSKERSTGVAIAPHSGGGSLVVGGTW